MDYSEFNFDEEYDLSPLKTKEGKIIANINFEAYLTDKQYQDVMDASDICSKYFCGEQGLLDSVLEDSEQTVYVNLYIDDVLNGQAPTKISVEIHVWSEIYAEEHGTGLLVGTVELTDTEEAQLMAKMESYVKKWDGNNLEGAVFEAKSEALDRIAREENFPTTTISKNNIVYIQQDNKSYNVSFDNDTLRFFAERTDIYNREGITDYCSLSDVIEASIYAQTEDKTDDIIVSISAKNDTGAQRVYNVPMKAEETMPLYTAIQDFIAEQSRAATRNVKEETFKEMLKCMYVEVHDTNEYAKMNGLCLADVAHLECIDDYSSIEEFAVDFPYLIIDKNEGNNGAIHSAAFTPYGVVENLERHFDDYFEADLLNEMKSYDVASDFITNTPKPTYDDVCCIGLELANSDNEREREFYNKHEFDFRVYKMLASDYNNIDMTKVTVEGKPFEGKEEIYEYREYKDEWISVNISPRVMEETLTRYNEYVKENEESLSFSEYIDKHGFSNGDKYMSLDDWRNGKEIQRNTELSSKISDVLEHN